MIETNLRLGSFSYLLVCLIAICFQTVLGGCQGGDTHRSGVASPRFLDVSMGSGHALAVTDDGDMYSWGASLSGELGRNNYDYMDEISLPKIVGDVGGFEGSEADFDQSFGYSSRFVYSWGDDGYGGLGIGNGPSGEIFSPARVDIHVPVRQVSVGTPQVLALSHDGTVYSWGARLPATLGRLQDAPPQEFVGRPGIVEGLPQNIAMVSAGASFNLALGKDGKVWGWGESGDGRLLARDMSYVTPVSLSDTVRLLDQLSVVQIATGIDFSLILTREGEVYAWGENDEMQLGCGSQQGETGIFKVDLPAITYIAAGSFTGYAISSTGEVYSWGRSMYGNLGTRGDGAEDRKFACPAKITGLPGVKMVDGASYTAAAIDSSGQVWTWGGNELLQLGRPEALGSHTATPGRIVLDPSAYPEEWPEDD